MQQHFAVTHLPLQLPLLVKPLLCELAKCLSKFRVLVSGFLHGHLRSRLAEEIKKELPLHQACLGILRKKYNNNVLIITTIIIIIIIIHITIIIIITIILTTTTTTF